jgi:hypothetical protein
LHLSNAQIGISFAHELQAAIGMTEELGAQTKIWTQTIQGKSGADQLLVRCGNPSQSSIEIS